MATFINCMFNCKLVTKMHFNLNGDVKFEACDTSKGHPIVVRDEQSGNIKLCFVGENPKVYIVDARYELPGRKEMSAITFKQQKEFQEEWKQFEKLGTYRQFLANKALSLEYDGKICSKCGILEIMENYEAFQPDEKPKKSKSKNKIYKSDAREAKSGKFLYCGKCKTISYCSKECQKTDWKDHKALCKHIILKTE